MPYLQVGDQLVIEKISLNFHKIGLKKTPFKRGDVIVFYPPFEKLNPNLLNKLARLTGLSRDIEIKSNNFIIKPFFFMPSIEKAYIKRIIGLPNEKIEIKAGDGIYINGEKLYELYPPSEDEIYSNQEFPMEKPNYSMKTFGDMPNLEGKFELDKEIIIPKDSYFCLGDNRNNSFDGHYWGFVSEDKIIGRAWGVIWRDLTQFEPLTQSEIDKKYYNFLQQEIMSKTSKI